MQLDLNAEGIFSDFGDTMPFKYFVYAAACSTVEIDVLTGEVELLTSDMVYDAGQSLNPLLDVGQVGGVVVEASPIYHVESVDDGFYPTL
jgi:xanthine dehydrogenase/oxidase